MSYAWSRLALVLTLAGCTRAAPPVAVADMAVAAPEIVTTPVSTYEGFRSDVHGVSALSHAVDSGPGWLKVRWYVLYPRGLKPTPFADLDRGDLRLRTTLSGVEAVVGGSDLVIYETEVRRLPAGRVHITGPHRLARQVDIH